MNEIKYYNEEDKDVIAKVIEIAEENGFSVDVYNNREDKEEYYFEFGKFSDCGRDFTFSIFFNTLADISDIADKIYEYYENFDVSYETYIWLDNFGHGMNGAPDDMLDAYNDTKQGEGFIEELYNAIHDNR